jgi:sugar phosphate isomerase/epimerase
VKLSLAIQTPEVPYPVPVALLSGSLDEKLAKAAAWGAQGVELMTSNPQEADPQWIKERCQGFGLSVAAVASGAIPMTTGFTLLNGNAKTAESAEARLSDLIDFAEIAGAPVVTIGSFRGKLVWVGDGARDRLVNILRRAADYAHARRILMALEALNRYEGDIINNHEEGLDFLAEVGHPAIGLLLDTYHVNIEESSYTEPFRRTIEAGRLFHVHVGDNNRLPPGHGLIDFPAIIKTLRDCSYTGYLSAELLAIPDPDTAARETLTYLHHLLEGQT